MNKKYNSIKIYHSCAQLEYFNVVLSTNIETTNKWLAPCCHLATTSMCSEVSDDIEESVKNFIELRQNMIKENKKMMRMPHIKRIYTSKCVNCPSYVMGNWEDETNKVTYINLSMYPSPCQSKCIYCCYSSEKYALDNDHVTKLYYKVCEIFSYMRTHDMVHKDALWQVSTGEISIHPHKNKILELVGGMNTTFLSNCFVFDQGIAEHLQSNKLSSINLSIDSGTAMTWKKVKGYNNFNMVLSNLRKYFKYCDQEKYQQITLKYIVLPGINTRYEDFIGVVQIMKDLKVKSLVISRNIINALPPLSDEYNELLDYIIELASICRSNDISYELFSEVFTISEREYIDDHVNKIEKNEVK